MKNPIIQVEVLRKQESTLGAKELRLYLEQEMLHLGRIRLGTNLKQFNNKVVADNVEMIQVCDRDTDSLNQTPCEFNYPEDVLVKDVSFQYCIYRLNTEGLQVEQMDDDGKNDQGQVAANHWVLPSSDFHGLWDSLIYEEKIKENLLKYAQTIMLFSDSGVDPNIIGWNRVVLLHGPPGTGKTSLCKALAHKLSIRMGHRYTHGQLVEINSHSLFSKYFSESGKLVVKMFSKIQELIEDSSSLVCVLIDEVESLTHTRERSTGNEPSDAIRVVNSVLTQIDQMRKYSNVLILTTSNITGAIDAAFVDRADIKQYIGLPSPSAIYKIYYSCLEELMRTKIIETTYLASELKRSPNEDAIVGDPSDKLVIITKESTGLSGRMLRKIPFLTYSYYMNSKSCTLINFLTAMEATVARCKKEKEMTI